MPRLPDSYARHPRAILWLVREGEVTIGGPDDDARPAFTTHVASFYISKLPITNLQYEAFDPDFHRSPLSGGDDDPATGVSWQDARGYCDWYARVSRKPMRLPTEIEWEHACRCGTTTPYFWGDDAANGEPYVWDASNSHDRVPPLKAKKPSPWGLHSMLGGVWEWTASLYRRYPALEDDGRDDPEAAGPRILRGGSFRQPLSEMACWRRRGADPETLIDDAGLRVARSL